MIDDVTKAYEKLAVRTKKLFEEGRETTADALDDALGKARKALEDAGEFGQEEGRDLVRFLRRDLLAAQKNAAKFGAAVRERLHPSRVASGVLDLASSLLANAADTFEEWSDRAEEALAYRTGEVTGAGTLTCNECGGELHFDATKRIPPCPKCRSTEFRKSY